MSQQTGAVKFFNETKGFGFIKPDNGGSEVFVHVTALNGLQTLANDQRVSFEVEERRRGPQAINVRIA
ncbi:cold-shock protein [Caedibacter taeniospiralis]|uniref:cold-shock protein n=1 Tax=Caedibacter taeniospiralis TaxID=28907 RepID=UPI000C27D74F|nr:cold-shock protein [Caedibacter taeniospiralis]